MALSPVKKASIKVVPRVHWPIFFSPKQGEIVTPSVIRESCKKANPIAIKKISWITLFGALAATIGGGTAIIELLRVRDSYLKTIGEILALVGFESLAVGFFSGVNLKGRVTKQGEDPLKSSKQGSIENFLEQVKDIVANKPKDEQNPAIRGLISENKNIEEQIISRGIEILLDDNDRTEEQRFKEKITYCLTQIGIGQSVEGLITYLNEGNDFTKIWAALELGKRSGDKNTTLDSTLEECLDETKDIDVQGAILTTLVQRNTDDQGKITQLVDYISDNKGATFIRKRGIKALETIRGPKTLAELELINLTNIQPESIRRTIESEIEKTRAKASETILIDLKSEDISNLITKYKGKETGVLPIVLEVISSIKKYKKSADKAISEGKNSIEEKNLPSRPVLERIFPEYEGKLTDPRYFLDEIYPKYDQYLKRATAYVEAIPVDERIDLLFQCLWHGNINTSEIAEEQLVSIGGKKVYTKAIEIVKKERNYEPALSSAMHILDKSRDLSAINHLINLAKDGSVFPESRRVALLAIFDLLYVASEVTVGVAISRQSTDHNLIQKVNEILSNETENENVLAAAAIVAGIVHNNETTKLVTKLLEHKSTKLHGPAAEALSDIATAGRLSDTGIETVVELLLLYLGRETNPWNLAQESRLLGILLRDTKNPTLAKRAIKLLTPVLEVEEVGAEANLHAAEALGEIGYRDQELIDMLTKIFRKSFERKNIEYCLEISNALAKLLINSQNDDAVETIATLLDIKDISANRRTFDVMNLIGGQSALRYMKVCLDKIQQENASKRVSDVNANANKEFESALISGIESVKFRNDKKRILADFIPKLRSIETIKNTKAEANELLEAFIKSVPEHVSEFFSLELIDLLIKHKLESDGTSTYLNLVDSCLENLADRRGLQGLIQNLQSSNRTNVSIWAAEELGKRTDASAQKALRESLCSIKQDPNVKAQSAISLGNKLSQIDISPIIDAMQTGITYTPICLGVIGILDRFGDLESLATLAQYSAGSSSAVLKKDAEAAVKNLKEIFLSNFNGITKATDLSKARDEFLEPFKKSRPKVVTTWLTDIALKGRLLKQRLEAVNCLYELGEKDALVEITQKLENKTRNDREVKKLALELAPKLTGTTRPVEHKTHPTVRATTPAVVGTVVERIKADAEQIKFLKKLIGVSREITPGYQIHKREELISSTCSNDDETSNIRAILHDIVVSSQDSLDHTEIKISSDDYKKLKQQAIRSLRTIGNEESVKALILLARSKNPSYASYIADTLEEIKDESAEIALKEISESTDGIYSNGIIEFARSALGRKQKAKAGSLAPKV